MSEETKDTKAHPRSTPTTEPGPATQQASLVTDGFLTPSPSIAELPSADTGTDASPPSAKDRIRARRGKLSAQVKRETHRIQLPSQGLPYATSMPFLVEQPYIEARLFGGEEEMELAESEGDVIPIEDLVLDKCIETPNCDRMLLTGSDALYVMIQLRMATIGKEYRFPCQCKFCGTFGTNEIDLSEQEVWTFDDEFPYEEIYGFTNARGDFVEWELLQFGHQYNAHREAVQDMAQQSEMEEVLGGKERKKNPYHMYCMAYQLRRVNNQSFKNFRDKFEFLRKKDSGWLNEWKDEAESVDTGMELMAKYQCDACKRKQDVPIQLGPEFFRRDRSNSRRARRRAARRARVSA